MQAGCIRATDRIWGRSASKHEPVALIQEVTFDPGNEGRSEPRESRSNTRDSRNLRLRRKCAKRTANTKKEDLTLGPRGIRGPEAGRDLEQGAKYDGD